MVMMYIGFVNGKFSRIFYPEDIKLPLALIIVSDISYGLICYILMFLLRGRFHFPYYFTSVILPEALYTIVVTIILYPLILKINQKLEEKEKGAHRNLFREIRDHIINIVTSRLTVLMILFAFFAGVLLYRCFNLQIVNGEEYLNDFILQIEKTRDISSTRGRILDRNGNVLAENELAYSVKIEDVFESSRNKNAKVNDVVYRLIKLIEKNGDSVITDFKIIIDEDGDYAYSVDGTALLRFQADVLGYRTIDELSEEEKAMTAQELIEYLSRAKGFAIGQYEDPENTKTPFVPGKGYTKEEWLQMVTIRYAMNLTSFRKYVGTTVATNVSAETVAVIMENSDQLDGVSIVEDTVRHYIDSKYFALCWDIPAKSLPVNWQS